MDHPPLPGFTHVTIACRACGHETVLDLQISVAELRRVWRGCAACWSPDTAIMLTWEGPPALPSSERTIARDFPRVQRGRGVAARVAWGRPGNAPGGG